MSEWENIALLVIGLMVLGVLLLLLYKTRKIHLMLFAVPTRRDIDNLYRELEAWQVLHRDLDFGRALPALRGFAASPDFLREVFQEVRRHKPQNVFELGSGTSTLVIAQTLQKNGVGHLYSLDHDALYAEQTRQWLRERGLEKWVTVMHAELTSHTLNNENYRWYSLKDVPELKFDIFVVDGPPASTQKNARYPALPLIHSRLAERAVVLVDDTERPDEREILARWSREFPGFRQEKRACEKGCVVLQRKELPALT